MVLLNGEWIAPFWGAEKSFITGQDMLGMQTTSIATYGVLVPGLTNLTRRIRYYGFYTWILEQFARRIGKDSVAEFQKYVRRAELLLAYMMADQFPDIKGVVGSQFAKKHLDDFDTTIDIALGAEKEEGKKTYWMYSSGAFGQYYLGALIALKLVDASRHNPKIYVATAELGRELCACFEASIPEDIRERFWDAVVHGKVPRAELTTLARGFCLTNIPPRSSERSFYRELLLGADFPGAESKAGYAFFRKDTMLLYLSYLQDADRFDKGISFWNSFYSSAWEGHRLQENRAAKGWMYYSINENTHFCLETFLYQLLLQLQDGALYLPEALELLSQDVIEALDSLTPSDINRNLPFPDLAKTIFQTGQEPFSDIEAIPEDAKSSPALASAKALIALIKIHLGIEDEFKELTDYSRFYRMDREGDCLSFYLWMRKHQDLSVAEFLKKLFLQKIINRHLEVAMRKMRNRNENTLKFIFEDNQIKLVSPFPPVFTTPRIPSLHFFLEDIGFLEQDNSILTVDGKKVLEGGIDG